MAYAVGQGGCLTRCDATAFPRGGLMGLSDRCTGAIPRIDTLCRTIVAECVKRGFHEAMARYGVNARETAMLGDKLLTDTLGARRSGVLMLMVEPRGGAVGAWNHVLHALQQPFKAASAHDERKKR